MGCENTDRDCPEATWHGFDTYGTMNSLPAAPPFLRDDLHGASGIGAHPTLCPRWMAVAGGSDNHERRQVEDVCRG